MSELDDFVNIHNWARLNTGRADKDGRYWYYTGKVTPIQAASELADLRARIAELEKSVHEAAPIMYVHGFWQGVSLPPTEQTGEQDK